MLVRNVAAEVASKGVQVNAIGTNFMDFPEFLAANRAEDTDGRARVEAQVPMGRLGGLDELASFAGAFLDGSSRFAQASSWPLPVGGPEGSPASTNLRVPKTHPACEQHEWIEAMEWVNSLWR